jgi:hypothetical protein
MWNLTFDLETVQCRCKKGAQFVQNVPIAQKLFWAHPMVLLGDEAEVKAYFGLFGDSVYLDARLVHGLRRMCHRFRNRFKRTRRNS